MSSTGDMSAGPAASETTTFQNDNLKTSPKAKRSVSYPCGPESDLVPEVPGEEVSLTRKFSSDPLKLPSKAKTQVKPFTKESLERLERKTIQLVREYGFQPKRKLSVEDGSRLPTKFEPFPKKLYGRPLEEIDNFIYDELEWNPSVAILVTVDFFLNTLNLYALLCVVSQYQEYRAGRGRAIDDELMRVPNIQYSTTQPTATSYLSSHNRKPVTYIEKATPTHSPTGLGPIHLEVAPVLTNRGPRKSVKFGDSSEMSMISPPPWVENKSSPIKGADTPPLIESGVEGGTNNRV